MLDASPDLPAEGGEVTVRGISRKIVRRSGTDDRPILRLSGAVSREDAERLTGAELRALVGLGEDEFWAHDLEGCAVVDGSLAVGFVRRMTALPSCEVLEVDRPDGSELLVPGRTAQALRTIVKAAAVKDNRRVLVDIVE